MDDKNDEEYIEFDPMARKTKKSEVVNDKEDK